MANSEQVAWLASLPPMFAIHDTPTDELPVLSPADVAFAKAELNEDPATREEFCKTLRDRVKTVFTEEEQEELMVRLDLKWILKFARGRKFDLEKSAALFEAHYRFRERKGYFWSKRPSLELFEAISSFQHMSLLSEKDKEGRTIGIMDGSKIDFEAMGKVAPPEMLMHVSFYQMLTWMADDNVQVRGMTFLQNLGTVSLSSMFNMSGGKSKTREMQKERMEMLKDCLPLRLKLILMLDAPWWMSIMMTMVKPFMPAKMSKRMKTVGKQDLETFIDRDLLPEHFRADTPVK